ncbi:peptide deformylase [Candidatus Saccharibacteria bacterium]|nr:peptide deformylase [Candidatus Saccharibacteria bacterium]
MSYKELIISLPNERLRQRSRKVGLVTKEISHVIEQMKNATLDWEAHRPHELGVALAAIQIGQPWRIVVIRNNFDDKTDQSFGVFINPEIIKLEGSIEEDFEGCLSVASVYGKVPRYNKVRIRALDEDGQEVRIKAEGFLARVLQHEIDHVNGVMFIDHIKDDHQAFFMLTKDGKLEPLDYEKISSSNIFRD